jgi:PIN domain nuclease of toxin-antitoxin system
MRFLIDTHCWIWAITEPERLKPVAVDLIESKDNVMVFSAVSALEIAIKFSIGKLRLPEPPEAFVASRMASLGMAPLPVHVAHALRVGLLPLLHRDPFDRLLVAQSQIERLPLMTADETITAYDVEIIWAGRSPSPRQEPKP